MTAHLLAISIGPVQDFIAAGRKTRDLWFGSFLLGELSRAAAAAVQHSGASLIFPAQQALAASLPVANKILAWLGPELDPHTVAAAARSAAQTRLAAFRQDALKPLPPETLAALDLPLLDAQLANLLEFAAAWHPVSEADYPHARDEVELLLAGRKALRDFAPAHGRDGIPKSALDPARESVLRPPDLAEPSRRRLRLKGAEQLDGVSLVKRLAEPRRFVSVARVAIDPFLRRAQHDEPAALAALARAAETMAGANHPSVESFANKLHHGLEQYEAFPFDTQLFYSDDRGDPDLRDGWPIEREQAAAFFQEADVLRQTLGVSEMPAYFAVLVADGDHMGRAISAMRIRAEHQALSAALAAFAAEADAIVRRSQGAMVYSGGDDVLAFLPLDRALACADSLRLTFAETMRNVTAGTPVSLSVGVAIAHYGEHLQRLLAWGREAERAAKSPRDPAHPAASARNALAVSLHTRGAGSGKIVVHPWSEDPVNERWNQWVDWHRRDLIPDSAAFQLGGLAREFRDLWPDHAAHGPDADRRREQLADLLRREVDRILARRRAGHGEQPLDDEQRTTLITLAGSDLAALRRLSDELLIARHIAAAADVAAGPLVAASALPLAGVSSHGC